MSYRFLDSDGLQWSHCECRLWGGARWTSSAYVSSTNSSFLVGVFWLSFF